MKTHSDDAKKRALQPRTTWSERETLALIGLYDLLLGLQEAGKLGRSKANGQISKAALVRTWASSNASAPWAPRTKGSVEAKLMNLSAVRQELGLSIVTGYKPLPNMATACRDLATVAWGAAL